jgi:hypothetical protein
MDIDWPTIVAITTVGIGLYTAITTRQKNASDVFQVAMDVAKEALAMRDKDIDRLILESTNSMQRIDYLVQYTEYLSSWVRLHYVGSEHPMTYDDYVRTIKQSK